MITTQLLLAMARANACNCDPFAEISDKNTVITSHSVHTDEGKAKLKGLNKFIIDGCEIFALNRKCAIKKTKQEATWKNLN